MSDQQSNWPEGIALAPRLDRAVLEHMVRGDFDFLCELVRAFCSELTECQSLATPTADVARKMTHRLSASAHYVGALRLSRMAAELETQAMADSPSRLAARWLSLQEEASGLKRELRSLVSRGTC